MKKSIKKYVGGVPELMTPRMASVKTADVPLVSGTPKQVSMSEPSFMDKAGNSMKGMDVGGMASQLGGSIAMMINANKKQDPTGRPYKTGTSMIKYQIGTQGTKIKKSESKVQKDINFILNANAANAKEKAKLNNRVAPKKLENKQAKLVKYQEGNEYAQASKLQKNAYDEMNSPRAAVAEPIAPRRSNIKLSQDLPANPAPKMMQNTEGNMDDNKNMLPQDLLSKKDRMISRLPKFIQSAVAGKAKSRIDRFEKDYNSAKNELGYKDDLSELDENRITRKIVSNRKERVSDAEAEEMAKRGQYTPEGYPDTFERTKGKMGSSIGFGDEYGPGRKEYIGQLRENKKKDLKERLAGREGMEKEYQEDLKRIDASNEERWLKDIDASSPSSWWSKNNPDNSNNNTIANNAATNSASTKQSNPYIAFKNMSAADQKKYRVGMSSGQDFEVDGRTYKAATSKQKMRSERMQKLYEKNPAMYNKLITKTSSFKEGTASLKVDNPRKVLKGKNGAPDTLYNTKTGRKQPFISADSKEEEKKKPVKIQETPKAEKTVTPKTKENKGLYQGSTLSELIGTAGIPALIETFTKEPKTKTGRMIRTGIKTVPAAIRFVHDAIADKKNKGSVDWAARGGNFVKDIGIGTAATGAIKTVRGTRQNYKEQQSAAAKETENPIAPSRKEALKKGSVEAANKAAVAKIPKKVIKYTNDFIGNTPEGKAAKINVAHKSAKDTKYTGVGNNKVGKENEFYVKGNSVDEKTYKAFVRKESLTGRRKTLSLSNTSPREKIQKVKARGEEIQYKKLADQHTEAVHQKAADEKFTGIGNNTVGKQDKYYINGVEVPDRTYHAKYKGEIKEQNKAAQAVHETSKKEDKTVTGPAPAQPTPLRKDVVNRQRAFSDVEKQKQEGFTEAEDFKKDYEFEKNKINTRPKDPKLTDEEHAAGIENDLNALEERKKAFVKGYQEKLKEKSAKREAARKTAQNPSTEENKTEAKTETKVETAENKKHARASRRANVTTETVNDLTEGKRVTETTKTQNKKEKKKPTESTSEGPSEGPVMTAESLGVTGKKKKGANSKANGARLIKYK
jgi:hypothetical protein